MTAKISVAMATYNGAVHLREQLDTIARQTLQPFELVVCDDGSSDGTIDILEEFALIVPFPVRIFINDSNLGFANNFLQCASLCGGEWVAFCDQDDVWFPEKLAAIGDVIGHSSEELVLVYHSAELVNEVLEPLGRRLPVISRDARFPIASRPFLWFVGGCVMCFKADLLADIDFRLRPRDNYSLNKGWSSGGYPWMPHDKWVCLLANICGETASLARVLTLYRRHGAAVTGPHERPSAASRVESASTTGPTEYEFLSRISRETSDSIFGMSSTAKSYVRRQRLLDGAEAFKTIAYNFEQRCRLYSSENTAAKLRIFVSLLCRGAYTRSAFSSFGVSSLLKDIAFILGVFRLKNSLGRASDD